MNSESQLKDLPIPDFVIEYYRNTHKFTTLTPVQQKAVDAGVLQRKSLLVCAPTASGKTFIATMAIANSLDQGKAIYLVPLKALASEKYKEYQRLFEKTPYKTILSVGNTEEADFSYLAKYNLLILTVEKLDSILRHKVQWLTEVKTIIIDEIHLLNDPSRGPTLEIVLTLLKKLLQAQIIGLSATIGNPQELAAWLGATLVQDSWRPVELKKGIYYNNKTEFY
ncbi:DEAD/DEAH box helicase [Candidatus Woesearchaeota archaeon]|nr:DEAD/DEAH box helicase [Candidatus Woesearchaeota archaeon]